MTNPNFTPTGEELNNLIGVRLSIELERKRNADLRAENDRLSWEIREMNNYILGLRRTINELNALYESTVRVKEELIREVSILAENKEHLRSREMTLNFRRQRVMRFSFPSEDKWANCKICLNGLSCRFIRAGFCCGFYHHPEERVCLDFMRSGTCPRGTECPSVHWDLHDLPASEIFKV
mgnify:CR=1 FL=1